MTEPTHTMPTHAPSMHDNTLSDSISPLQAAFPPAFQLLADGASQYGNGSHSFEPAHPIQGSTLRPPVQKSPLQRKISYATSQYNSQAELVQALQRLFPSHTHAYITRQIEATEAQGGRPHTPNSVFQAMVKMVSHQFGLQANFGVTSSGNTSTHGPMVPDRDSRSSAQDQARADRTFNFNSVTLGQLTLIGPKGQKEAFVDRSQSKNEHAEDGLLQQVKAFLATHPSISSRQISVNLTINNFFCAHETTGKSNPAANCLDQIIALQKACRFKRFHVYFKNPYGNAKYMRANVAKLQRVGILVTGFTNEAKKAAPSADYLDPSSDTDSDSGDDSDFDEDSKMATGDHFADLRPNAPEVELSSTTYRFAADEVANDGHCFFQCLRQLGVGGGRSVAELRTLAATNRRATPNIGSMEAAVWADRGDIAYLARSLGLTITVVQFDLQNNSGRPIRVANGSTHIYLAHIQGGHFTPLRPK